MNVEAGLQLDLLGALRRRAKLSALVAGVVLLASYWFAMALPNQYESFATLFVEPQAISDRLVQAGIGESDLSQRLNNMTAEILSRPRLSRIIDELGVFEDESQTMLREDLIRRMRSQISIVPVLPELAVGKRGKDATVNTFTVSFTSDDALMAAAVVQRLANDFIREHIEARVQVTQKSLEFIDAERNRLSEQLDQVEAEIAKVKTANSGRLPDDLTTNQRRLERGLSDLRSAQREHDNVKSDLAFWTNQALMLASAPGRNPDASPLAKLQALELHVGQMRARGFTAKHPDLIIADQEMEELKQALAVRSEEPQEEEPEPIASQAWQNAEASKRRAAMQAEAVGEEIDRLKGQLDEVNARLEATPRVAAALDVLNRERSVLESNLADYGDRRQEAMVQVDLERRQLGEQFRILEPAFAASDPSSPDRPLILVMGLMLGIALGVGAGLLAEGVDSSYHGAKELQSSLGVPVLAAIPRIQLESDLAVQRKRLVQTALAVAAITIFSLAGGATTYMLVNGAPGWLAGLVQPAAEEAGAPSEGASQEGGGRL